MVKSSHNCIWRGSSIWKVVARILCGITLLISAGLATISSVAAQPGPAETRAESGDSVLSHSALPLRDRALQERLRRIESLVTARDFSAALAEIRRALEARPGSQLLKNESADLWQEYSDCHSVIEELLRSLPPDSLDSYSRQTESVVRPRYLKAVRDFDFQKLREISLQFPLTRSSREALQILAAWHLDRREFAAAEAVGKRLARLPQLSKQQRELVNRIVKLSREQPAEENINAESTNSSTRRSATEPEQLTLRARLFPSLNRPVWQVDSGLDDEAAQLTRHALHEHFEQSIPILRQARPLIVDGIVIRRSLNQVAAYSVETGRELWASDSASETGQSASRLTMNLSLQELMAQKLARDLQVNSLQSRLSSDGERVFTVESGSGSFTSPFPNSSSFLAGSNYQSQTQNQIVARDLQTGKVIWSLTDDAIQSTVQGVGIASSRSATTRKIDAADIYFCGLPTRVDHNVIGLVQVGDLLRLYAADRSTGLIDWSLNIAEVSRLSPSDSDWRSLDCRIKLINGVLVCPTGAGLFIGVDLATRSVIWSRRYSRADTPLEVTRLPFAPTRPQRPWWQGWRDNRLLSVEVASSASTGNSQAGDVESILIAASPDASEMKAINPRTGQRIWSLGVESPVDLTPYDQRVIVLSRHSVMAVDAMTGKRLWETPCCEPIGTGYSLNIIPENSKNDGEPVVIEYYVFPVRGGSLVAVNCKDGSLIENVERLESLSGCLISAGDHIVTMNADRLSTWSMLSAISVQQQPANAALELRDEDALEDREIDQAVFDRSSGSFSKAVSRLRWLKDSTQKRREIWKTLLAWFESEKLSPDRLQELEAEAEEVVGKSSISELIQLRHAAARAAIRSGDPILALKFYSKLQALNPSGEPRFLKPEPLRSVRHDRLIQGEVLDLIQSYAGDEAVSAVLAQAFDDLAESASASRDPFALQRFTHQWQSLPVALQYALEDRSRIGLRYGQKQLSLLTLADSADHDVSIHALQGLMQLYESRSYDRDANAIRRKLNRLNAVPGVPPGDLSVRSSWNAGPAVVSEQPEQNLDTTFIPVPVDCPPGTLFDRLNVAINPRSSRNDTVLRFYGDGFSGSWQTVLTTSASPLKSVGRMYRGWGIGHFLVLQLGGELFGISPFDASGEPRVQRVWSIDMADGNRQEDHQYASAVPGFTEEELTMLDAFGRPIAKVGPVRAGYLCFQTRGKLVCLDTLTGQRLWQRYELPRAATRSGDGQNIFLIQPEQDRVTTLRVVDGATLSQFRLSDAVGFQGQILRASGDQMLVADRSSDSAQHPGLLRISKLVAVNLQLASVEWSTEVASESTAFAVSQEWLGIISASGRLQIFDSESGHEISAFDVSRPERIRAVHVSSDASGHVIALSDVAESAFLNVRSPGGSRRNPPVSGQLLAIDSQRARLKWQRSVEQIRFLLDQPKNAPCIVLSHRRSRSSGTKATESVLHVINRETGEDILFRRGASPASDFTFEPHADQNRFSIRMARKSIRFVFAPGP